MLASCLHCDLPPGWKLDITICFESICLTQDLSGLQGFNVLSLLVVPGIYFLFRGYVNLFLYDSHKYIRNVKVTENFVEIYCAGIKLYAAYCIVPGGEPEYKPTDQEHCMSLKYALPSRRARLCILVWKFHKRIAELRCWDSYGCSMRLRHRMKYRPVRFRCCK